MFSVLYVCLSAHGGGAHVTTTHNVLDFTIQAPPTSSLFDMDLSVQGLTPAPALLPSHQTSIYRDLPPYSGHGTWLKTCSNWITWGPPPQCWHLVAFEAHTFGKWAVHIILRKLSCCQEMNLYSFKFLFLFWVRRLTYSCSRTGNVHMEVLYYRFIPYISMWVVRYSQKTQPIHVLVCLYWDATHISYWRIYNRSINKIVNEALKRKLWGSDFQMID